LTGVPEFEDVVAHGSELEARFAPGSNVKGAVGGANWCFLLPSLDLGRVVCLGRPSLAGLTTLAGLGDEVAVCAPTHDLRRLRRSLDSGGPANVQLLETNVGAAPLPDGTADLVVVPRLPLRRRARADAVARARRLLKPGGIAYVESRFIGRLDTVSILWLAPAAGEVRMAAPLQDRQAIAYLEGRFPKRGVIRRQLLRRPRRVLARQPAVIRIVRRRGALVGRPPKRFGAALPEYVRTIAAAAGVDLEKRRWALAAPGDYPSQKVLLFLFPPAGGSPESVVKITRDPDLSFRLENEWRALTILYEQGVGTDDALPRPLFFGSHRGLAVLGESAIEGVPFRRRTQATADCPFARAAVEWLLELGRATASPARADTRGALSKLDALSDQFTGTYRLEPHEEDFVRAHVAALVGSGGGFPLVFQHGDPGPWNVLVTPAGRPAFLDWEGAEPLGMPLWDLFHFLRSYGLIVSRAAGTRDPLQSFTEQVLQRSAVNRLLVDATNRFVAGTGLAAELVEPLFYTCWMHRGVKEAATLPSHRLESGRYVSILRLAIERRDSPGLSALFATGPTSLRQT
jgi:Phosphotransferase enzyme family/Methyltransferase domain